MWVSRGSLGALPPHIRGLGGGRTHSAVIE